MFAGPICQVLIDHCRRISVKVYLTLLEQVQLLLIAEICQSSIAYYQHFPFLMSRKKPPNDLLQILMAWLLSNNDMTFLKRLMCFVGNVMCKYRLVAKYKLVGLSQFSILLAT